MAGMKKLYLIGSLRNPRIRDIGNAIREWGYDVFDDWHAVGPEADDHWRDYEKARGRSYAEALQGAAAQNTFHFDKRHLDAADAAILVAPAGKSAHMELGYMLGKGKPGFILFYEEPEPERWDVMYLFATAVCSGLDELRQTIETTRLRLSADEIIERRFK